MIEEFVPGDVISIYSDSHKIIEFKANGFGHYSLRDSDGELCLSISIKTDSIFAHAHENE